MAARTRPEQRPWALVLPVKGGPGAKSRLGARGRPGLATALALDALDAVLACRDGADPRGAVVGDVVVVTGDDAVRAAVQRAAGGAAVVADPGGGLDAAAAAGLAAVAERAPRSPRAVLLPDVPCLRPQDLRAALAAAVGHPSAVVPDAGGDGTVLLTQAPGPVGATAFGPGSAAAHQRLGAVRLDLALPRLRRDVDVPADLEQALALGVGPRTAAALAGRAYGAPTATGSARATTAPRPSSLSKKCS